MKTGSRASLAPKQQLSGQNCKVEHRLKPRDVPGFWRDVPGRNFAQGPLSARRACTLARRACTRPPDHTTGRPDKQFLRDGFSPKDAAQVSKTSSITPAFKAGVHQSLRQGLVLKKKIVLTVLQTLPHCQNSEMQTVEGIVTYFL